jgi:hypothetical protein
MVSILTPRRHQTAIRRKGNAGDITRVPCEGAHQRPIRHTPQLDGGIPTPRRQQTAIRRKGNAVDSIRVPCEGAHQRPIRHTPQLDGGIPTPRRQQTAIRRKGNAVDIPSVCPVRVRTNAPSDTRHNLMVASPLPDAIKLPSGEKATLLTLYVCPVRVRTNAPSDTRHNRMVRSHTPRRNQTAIRRKGNAVDTTPCAL